tara:strand:- start:3647 stop:7756 length:4110 start_codon:yes stop_codon:yes gene_type:complete
MAKSYKSTSKSVKSSAASRGTTSTSVSSTSGSGSGSGSSGSRTPGGSTSGGASATAYSTSYATSSTSLIASELFSANMPKLVQGVAYVQKSNELHIDILYKDSPEYDKVVNVLDPSAIQNLTTTYSPGKIHLTYKKWRQPKQTNKSLTLIFATGDKKTVSLKVPGKKSHLKTPVTTVTSALATSPYENMMAVENGQTQNNTLSVGVFPKSDPYDVFRFKGVFSYNLPFVFYINSDSLNEVFVDKGVESVVKTVQKGIDPRGVGHLYPGELEQEVQFINIVGNEDSAVTDRDELLNKLDSSAFTSGFLYGKNLFDIEDDAKRIYVCVNEGDSSYWGTTLKDCDGNTIDTRYTTGEDAAVFLDGQCCTDTCQDLSITLTNTSDTDANFATSVGKIKVEVTGGQGDYSYNVTNGFTGTDTTTSSPDAEHEFTGLPFASDEQSPYKIIVTDANGCKVTSYIHLGRLEGSIGLVQGCTDSGSMTYDSSATLNTGCVYCKQKGPRGEDYGGLSFGTSLAISQPTGEELIINESSRVTDATAVGNSDGKIYFRGSVALPALAAINQDVDSDYSLALKVIGANERANDITNTEILALSDAATATGDLENEFGSLARGWYAIVATVSNVTALANCKSIYRFKVGYGGCIDPLASNFDREAEYQTENTCEYNCSEKNASIIVNKTNSPCVKTVSIPRIRQNESITWKIGGENKFGPGPHLIPAGEYVSVYIENAKTKCTRSAELFIPEEDCGKEGVNVEGDNADKFQVMSSMRMNTGGCTDIHAVNYNCDAIWDDGTCIPVVTGCTDPTSNNYNHEANTDDGSCDDAIIGCLYPNAINYNPLATINDVTTCNFPGLGSSGAFGGAMVVETQVECPTTGGVNSGDWDPYEKSNIIEFFEFNVDVFADILDGSKLSAYQIGTGGVFEVQGFTPDQLTFPLDEMSNLTAAGTWKIAGTNANIYKSYTNANGQGYGWNGLNSSANPNVDYDAGNGILPGTMRTEGATLTFGAGGLNSSTAHNWVADEGAGLGPGVYIWELKLKMSTGKTIYYRMIKHEPSQFNSICNNIQQVDILPQVHWGCTDPLASNYTGYTAVDATLFASLGGDVLSDDQSSSNSGMEWYGSSQEAGLEVEGLLFGGGISNGGQRTKCIYNQGGKMCLPPRIDDNISYLNECVMNGTVNWYNNHITGGSDLCEDIALWTTVMIKYLISRKGLECMYNCSDKATVDYTPVSCEEKWKAGGERMWTYDSTTYQGNGDYAQGTVIKFDNTSLLPWMGESVEPQYWLPLRFGPGVNGNPYGRGGRQGWWRRCIDDRILTENTNYLDKFFKFATRYCKSCNPCSFVTGNQNSFVIPTESFAYSTDGDDHLTVGGLFLDIDGDEIR